MIQNLSAVKGKFYTPIKAYFLRRRKELDTRRNDREDRRSGKDSEKEQNAIKDRYLGAAKKKKKVRKQNERKFVFDWDAGY